MPFLLHLFLFLIPNPALLSHGASVASESQPVKLVVSERCISDPNAIEGQEFDLTPGSPLVLTHRIRLVPSTGSGSCCQSEFAAVNERIEALEREVSELREKCGGLNGGCCTSQQSQGVGCSTVRPPTDECLNDCNDQGRCIDGKCVCFAGFSGPDCSVPDCPGDCSNKGKCVNGKCVCDPGFAGPDCSVKTCPNNCSNNGRCVNGKCVCNAGFTGSDCSIVQCPGNCNNKGRCVNGKCVCVAGFTGPDCSEKSCPGNCNNKGRCVDGKCVCNPEFTGPDCSERSCPKNCNNKGRCVNGKCVCDAGFTGLDCSEKSCPRNCNNKGRCVDGKCFCNSGFTGLDCSEKTCPGNCNNKGRCVDGKCVCNSGFTGLDCSEKTCPGNCNNKGRCVDGKCVCNSGFTGLDCSEKTCPGNCNNKGSCVNGKCVCDEGFTGLDCSEKTCPRNCKNKGRCVDGKCVCNPGFTGLDCSEKTCPGNCNNKGRCVNGKCVCNEGFTGLDCSEKTCPGNCKNKGRCVNGKCVCDAGFTGPDCSEKTCPNNCSNKGRCVNGKCVCDDGFTGPDCSEKTCPGNCNNKGRCVNGQCVCEVGFTGPDCSTKTCLNNCSNRGRCVNGKCVCNPKFAEPDCSECTDGFAGPDCATALIAVSHLSARNITESSVTLFWTPPAVQYNTYRITFTSEKENDQITERVNGGISSYTQVGLAPGQRYIVTIIGEKDGKMGAKSTTPFQTLISGPKNLHVVKTSTTSVIVQWEAAQGQIDRYILSTAPNQTDGSGEGRQEKTLPSGIDSAQIDGLQPGRLYDVSLVAVKDGTRSLPATVQATPGPEPPSHLSFSDITDTSLSVSWRRPKSSVSGFKVTYIHSKEGEPISVTVGSGISTLALTKLSPGSTYEVTIISVLGLDESDPIKDFIITLPDPPTDLRAINITDTKALLLWRPALATADQYIITYHAEEDTGSNISVKVSGNAVEQQLQALKASTKYRVTIFSQLGDQKSSSTHTSFTTASGSPGKGEAPRDLVAKRVTARTAVLSWKPPSSAVTSYKLTYFIKGGERKEVTLNPGVSEHKLKGLHPSSKYTALLRGERGGVFTSTISTEFTTVTLRFPYPSDCSQELLNGELDSGLVEIFPGGKDGGSVKVYCDMETDKGGWTVFQRRKDGKTKFFRSWHEYRKGFGDLEGEFWLGNDALHNLTAMTPMNMRVDLRTQNESVYAHYASFAVDTARKHYIVHVSGYSGTAGDSMQYHDKRPFSTFDRDPQPLITRCAMSYKGGWWYRNCHEANLNGLYDTHTNHQGVIWTAWKGTKFSIPFTEMKIRPASFTP
ncbi:tenascin isoform X3 [Silurus meridionalis]|uniref:tenascin isoform X2 n=1 Tax=Silurus meridionalis TaxID=175797 RepID=UPI001EEA976C|nr:tenascin isoform X2 [Silurus meridionalis]XP_046714991.1 tenascin isoform X3 [Silurus meridionalis]